MMQGNLLNYSSIVPINQPSVGNDNGRLDKILICKSRPIFLIICFLFMVNMASCATASTDYNTEKLLEMLVERVLPEGLDGRAVYVSNQPLSGGTTISSWKADYIVPEKFNQAWFLFVDDVPEANWEHPCRYVFIDIETGNYRIIHEKTPPKNFSNLNKLFPKN